MSRKLPFPRSILAAAIALPLLLSPAAVKADVQFSTLELPASFYLPLGWAGGAADFTTDNKAYILNSVTVQVQSSGEQNLTWQPTLFVVGEDGLPGVVVPTSFTASSSVFSSGISNVSFTASTEIALAANTRYFFALETSAGEVEWEWR